MPPSPPNPTYYEILSLSPATLSSQEEENPTTTASLLKRAYHRALLTHHPDKTKSKNPSNPTPLQQEEKKAKFTIDQISTAYATLSRPSQRQAYDRSLLLQSQSQSLQTGGGVGNETGEFQTGIEAIDLDDLDYQEGVDGTTTWYRSCRCGNPRGYHFTEADLVEAGDVGELMVGCADCSLWLRVYFAVVDDDGDDDDEGEGGRQAEAGGGSGTKEGLSVEAGAAGGR